ncbi:hypothetical protein [Nitrolancea hollandica]|nr:hypothetical protein [Nitrolancea hollandica]
MTERSPSRYSWSDLFPGGGHDPNAGSWEVRMLFGQYDGLSPEDIQFSFLALEQMIEQITDANPGMRQNTALQFLRGLTALRLRQQAQGLPDWTPVD